MISWQMFIDHRNYRYDIIIIIANVVIVMIISKSEECYYALVVQMNYIHNYRIFALF